MSSRAPSYGVFMVDIFASSIGIFILVSLLYLVSSAGETSDKKLMEKFYELVQQDEIPVHFLRIPNSSEPLHDWAERAQFARQQQEPIILLLEDEILLLHTMQRIATDKIVESNKIANYYQQFNKQNRLFLEIHYYDTYHKLTAKIASALPPNVSVWQHWAFDAGNLEGGSYQLQEQASNEPFAVPELTEETGSGDSDEGTGSEAPTPANTAQNQKGSPSGSGDSNEAGAQSAENGRQGETAAQGSGEAQGQSSEVTLSEMVAQLMLQSEDDQAFTQQILTPSPSPLAPTQSPAGQSGTTQSSTQEAGAGAAQDSAASSNNSSNSDSRNSGAASDANNQLNAIDSASQSAVDASDTTQAQDSTNNPALNTPALDNNTRNNNSQGSGQDASARSQSSRRPPSQQQQLQEQAKAFIRRNIFLKLPLQSPMQQFPLEVQVPGHLHNRKQMDNPVIMVRPQPGENFPGTLVSITPGDLLVPGRYQDAQPRHNRDQQEQPAQWLEITLTTLADVNHPISGWVYGRIVEDHFLLPLMENQVQPQGTEADALWVPEETEHEP